MQSAGRTLAMVGGLLFIASAIFGAASLVLGLVLGVGVIIMSGMLKHRIWAGAVLVIGFVFYSETSGIIGLGGAIAVIIAAVLGLSSTLV